MDQITYRPLIRTQSDVERMWRRLMSPLGFSTSSLWVVFIEDRRPLPRITEFEDLPAAPDDAIAAGLTRALENLATPQTSLAFLRTRPGGGSPGADDLAWARVLYAVGNRARIQLETIHLAHDHEVLPIPVDSVIGPPR